MKRERLTPNKTQPRHFGSNTNEPHWLQKCELSFLRTGKLNLSTVPDPDLSAIKMRTTLKELNISRTKLTSFEGFAYQPNLSVVNANYSQISTFKNFASISHATTFCFKNTPLAKNQTNYIIGLLLFAECDRIIIDGKLIVSDYWQKKVAAYPSFTRELLNLGWPLKYPCPSLEEMRDLCRDYNITYVEDEEVLEINGNTQFQNVVIQDEEEEVFEGYMGLIDSLMQQHNDVIAEAARHFELLDMNDERFTCEVRNILEEEKHLIFEDQEDVDLQIVSAVRSLCLKRQLNQKELENKNNNENNNNETETEAH